MVVTEVGNFFTIKARIFNHKTLIKFTVIGFLDNALSYVKYSTIFSWKYTLLFTGIS